MTGNYQIDQNTEHERSVLCQEGAETSWMIDLDLYQEIGFNGYRYFRIMQVGPNSSGIYNLALSNIELYGKTLAG